MKAVEIYLCRGAAEWACASATTVR